MVRTKATHSVWKDDGWIYDGDGNKREKWFERFCVSSYHSKDRFQVWKPKLQDIKKMEQKRWDVIQRKDKIHKQCYVPLFDKIVELKKAHYTYDYSWTLIKVDKCVQTYGLIEEFLDEKPKKVLNLEIGNAWKNVDKKLTRYQVYVDMYTTVLDRMLSEYVKTIQQPSTPLQLLKLDINGRIFWFRSDNYGDGTCYWMKFYYPEEDVVELKVE